MTDHGFRKFRRRRKRDEAPAKDAVHPNPSDEAPSSDVVDQPEPAEPVRPSRPVRPAQSVRPQQSERPSRPERAPQAVQPPSRGHKAIERCTGCNGDRAAAASAW
jgi:FtsZ-interacting cell division protein ZipA